MNLIFTEFVSALDPGHEPDRERFDPLWEKLRDALIREMRRRGLWSAPPRYLGICGATSWSDGAALNELLAECYTFVFAERLPGLKAQLEIKENIEGLVFRNIRNFLYDIQKRNDPLGFRTFAVLQRAVRRLIRAGQLQVAAGDPKVLNETVLCFGPDAETPGSARSRELEDAVPRWCDDLLPELVTARGKAVDGVVARLAGRVRSLPDRGVGSFWFEDLTQPMKAAVRARWSAIGSMPDGKTGLEKWDGGALKVVRVVDPDPGPEERDAFEKLSARVTADLEAREKAPGAPAHLKALWGFLLRHAGEPRDDRPPSRRQVAGLLGISRDRLPGLYRTLGHRVEACRMGAAW